MSLHVGQHDGGMGRSGDCINEDQKCREHAPSGGTDTVPTYNGMKNSLELSSTSATRGKGIEFGHEMCVAQVERKHKVIGLSGCISIRRPLSANCAVNVRSALERDLAAGSGGA